MKHHWLPIVLMAVFTVACGGGSSSSSMSPSALPTAPFSQTDLTVGTGADAAAGRQITVNYTGWIYDPTQTDNKGRQFDSSIGRQPFVFTLGAGQVIQGWDRGLVGMKVGGQRRLVIPPELAYGSAGSSGGVVPPNATLVFDVQLMNVGV